MKFCPAVDGMSSIHVCIGPLGKTVEDCAIMMRALLNSKNYSTLSLGERDLY